MKTQLAILAFGTLLLASCSKNNSTTNPPASDSFVDTTAGSTWTYHEVDSSQATPVTSDYTLTSTSRDTTISNQKYHIFSYSYGGNQYMAQVGNDYYQYDSVPVPGGVYVNRLYLKGDAGVNTTWTQPITLDIPNSPLPITLTVTNTIVEKGISRTVNGISYSNVVHVSTSLSSPLIPATNFTSSIDSYYAPKYGMIESKTVVHLDAQGLTADVNLSTLLTSATLK